jgi:putative tryptophan/tyrosine transport system substrate-binding protein
MRKLLWLSLAIASIFLVLTPLVGAQGTNKKVAVMWEGKAGMSKRVLMGFVAKMKNIAPNVEVVTRMDIRNMAEAENIFHDFEKTMNGIVFLRSSGAEFLAKVDPKVPCFVGGCNNPLYFGTVKNLEAPDGKITGVTYFIPYEKRFEAIKALFPRSKSVALLAQKGHPSTAIDQEGTRSQCERLGIAYHEVIASNVSELVNGVEKIIDRVDLLIMSSTSLVLDNSMALLAISNKHKMPIFSYAADRAAVGITAELAADDTKLGAMLAESVADVVVKGKPVAQVPVKYDSEPRLIVNEASIKNIGLSIPDEVLAKAEKIK